MEMTTTYYLPWYWRAWWYRHVRRRKLQQWQLAGFTGYTDDYMQEVTRCVTSFPAPEQPERVWTVRTHMRRVRARRIDILCRPPFGTEFSANEN